MLHAGVLKKFGLYGLLRVAFPLLPEGAQSEWALNLLLWLLLGNLVVIGLGAIAQRDLDLMLGHSSVMHMGYIFLGLASWNLMGMSGAVLLMFAHGVAIALLFHLNGVIREKTGTVTMERLGGLAASAPFLGLAFGLAAFASAGLPGFANFAGEILVFFGAFGSEAGGGKLWFTTATMVALWGVVMSAVYLLRAYRSIFKGQANGPATIADLQGAERWPSYLLLAALLVVGFFPNVLLQLIRPALGALDLSR
jgi:NADH-quinone oxidoreductase subunit M